MKSASGAVSAAGRPVVTILYRFLPQYRIPFYEALRAELGRRGVILHLVYGQPDAEEATKQDVGAISWGHQIQNRRIRLGALSVLWQPCWALVRRSDLVIVEQASKLLLNYVLLAGQLLGGPKVAFWGHGANLQRQTASRVGEALKRRVSRWPHWWFAYTKTSADLVRGLSYPPERITVVQNALDTASLQAWRASIDDALLAGFRERVGIRSENVAIYVGGLYAAKRLGYLLDAARVLRRRIVDFELIIIGAGPEQGLVTEAARAHDWIHYPGPAFGADKVLYFALSRVMTLPGAVGLAVLDAFALEVPLVTIDMCDHGPEIDYLRDGENGLKLPAGTEPDAYAAAVAAVLSDEEKRQRLQAGCRAAAKVYTLEAMVGRFADGVMEALRSAP